MPSRRLLPLLVLAFAAPGCIVDDIRKGINSTNDNLSIVQQQLNELKATNQKLDKLQSQLDALDTRLGSLDTHLASVDQRLEGVGQRLDGVNSRLSNVDQKLASADERLAILQSVQVSLQHIDAHLASLRVTIEKINSSIPFFDIGGSPPSSTQPDATSSPTTRPRYRLVPVTQPATQESKTEGATDSHR